MTFDNAFKMLKSRRKIVFFYIFRFTQMMDLFNNYESIKNKLVCKNYNFHSNNIVVFLLPHLK